MREIGASEAKRELSALLDKVAGGEEVIITRHGRPVARLMPMFDRAKAERAVAGLRKVSRGLSLTGLSVKELAADGRA